MANYFHKFPKIGFNPNHTKPGQNEYQQIANIFVRLGLAEYLRNHGAIYHEYLVKEGETPEILADKIYGDVEAHWLILLTNNIIDPQYDWVMDYRTFQQHIIDKYGSIETAQTTYHHYEQVISRYDSGSGETTVTRLYIDKEDAGATFTEPFEDYDTLAEEVVEAYDMGDGSTCTETITKNRVSFYDWEEDQNEQRRSINLIIPEYWPQIKAELSARLVQAGGDTSSLLGLRTFSN